MSSARTVKSLLDVKVFMLARVISAAYQELVKTGDFRELKDIVRDIANQVAALAEGQRALAEEQRALTTAIKQLAIAQTHTERALDRTRSEVAGIGDTLGYTLENEAYRELPAVLRARHGIEVTHKFIRTVIGGTEIDFYAEGTRNGDSDQWITVDN